MVFQNYALYPHMTVFANMAFPLRQAKMPKPAIAERVEEVARILQLTEHLKRRPAKPLGRTAPESRHRRAIVREPKAFLLDEPLSNLDAKLRVQMRGELAQLHADLGVTTIFVTQHQTGSDDVRTASGRAFRRKAASGRHSARSLLHPPGSFRGGFHRQPSMNLMRAELRTEGGLRLEIGTGSVPVSEEKAGKFASAVRTGKLVAGVRPESLRLLDPSHAHAASLPRGTVRLIEVIEPEMYVYLEGFALTEESGMPREGRC